MNTVAVTKFFHRICTGVFDALLAAGTNRTGQVSALLEDRKMQSTQKMASVFKIHGNPGSQGMRIRRLTAREMACDRIIKFCQRWLKFIRPRSSKFQAT